MKDDAVIASLRAEVDTLRIMLMRVMEKAGISIDEQADLEEQEIIRQCGRTLDFRPLQEHLRRKIARRTEKEVSRSCSAS